MHYAVSPPPDGRPAKLAQFERNLIQERTKAGLTAARNGARRRGCGGAAERPVTAASTLGDKKQEKLRGILFYYVIARSTVLDFSVNYITACLRFFHLVLFRFRKHL